MCACKHSCHPPPDSTHLLLLVLTATASDEEEAVQRELQNSVVLAGRQQPQGDLLEPAGAGAPHPGGLGRAKGAVEAAWKPHRNRFSMRIRGLGFPTTPSTIRGLAAEWLSLFRSMSEHRIGSPSFSIFVEKRICLVGWPSENRQRPRSF